MKGFQIYSLWCEAYSLVYVVRGAHSHNHVYLLVYDWKEVLDGTCTYVSCPYNKYTQLILCPACPGHRSVRESVCEYQKERARHKTVHPVDVLSAASVGQLVRMCVNIRERARHSSHFYLM